MKNTIKTLADGVASESTEYCPKDVMLCEYMLRDAEESDNGWLFFLSDDEIEEFESDEEKADEYRDKIKKFLFERYNYYPVIEIDTDEFENIMREEIGNARGFDWTGWRIPIYVEPNTGELSSGSWISQNSWQPDAVELCSISPWYMNDRGYTGEYTNKELEEGEEGFNDDDVEFEVEEILEFYRDTVEGTFEEKNAHQKAIELV